MSFGVRKRASAWSMGSRNRELDRQSGSELPHSKPSLALIGYRGTGKSTVARLLAERLGWDWQDADEYLERKFGRFIRDIFAQEGEAGFRDKEAAMLRELCDRERQVLAAGGGVVLRPENQAALRQNHFVIWLTADAITIWDRLQGDSTTGERRPDLTASGGLTEIQELLAVREPLYRAWADLVVDTVGRTPEDVANVILKELEASSASPQRFKAK